MPNFNKNRVGKQVGKTLAFRSRRSNSQQVNNLWIGLDLNPPTNLSAVPSITSVAISFTEPSGDTPTNFRYATSTNGGASYGAFTALSPADATSPITISGLTASTAYFVKLVSELNGEISSESAPVSFTTLTNTPTNVEYLVIAGGGGGRVGGGGAGGYRNSVVGETSGRGSSAESRINFTSGATYTVTVGAGSTGTGNNSSLSGTGITTVTSSGGGLGADLGGNGGNGGAGGGPYGSSGAVGLGTSNQGYDSGSGSGLSAAAGGGGAGGAGGNASGSTGGAGGAGLNSSITTSSVCRGGGGGGFGSGTATCGGGAGSGTTGTAGSANTGGGGGGGNSSNSTSGGSGVVIVRWSNTVSAASATTGSPTYANAGGYHIYTFTGSGSFTVV